MLGIALFIAEEQQKYLKIPSTVLQVGRCGSHNTWFICELFFWNDYYYLSDVNNSRNQFNSFDLRSGIL